jgi:hypothetical protein
MQLKCVIVCPGSSNVRVEVLNYIISEIAFIAKVENNRASLAKIGIVELILEKFSATLTTECKTTSYLLDLIETVSSFNLSLGTLIIIIMHLLFTCYYALVIIIHMLLLLFIIDIIMHMKLVVSCY